MNRSDEELQNIIEAGNKVEPSTDATAYKKIFSVLQQNQYQLSPGFADSVITRLESQRSWADYVWFGLGIIAFIIAAIIAVVMSNWKVGLAPVRFLSGYAGLFIFGLAFILLLNYIDRHWVRPTTSL